MATVQQQTTQLEFHQAMADFKIMFPLMDDDVIEAVLRSNQGAVDATIDQLLAMASDIEAEQIRNEIDLEPNTKKKEIIETKTFRTRRRWKKREEKRFKAELAFAIVEADLEDERIAMLLQNEEFLADLRWNQDFLSVLETDSPTEDKLSSFPSKTCDDEAMFKERLKNMGKMSKKKFSQLARVFTGRQRKSPTAKGILNQGTTPSKDSLLLKEDADSD